MEHFVIDHERDYIVREDRAIEESIDFDQLEGVMIEAERDPCPVALLSCAKPGDHEIKLIIEIFFIEGIIKVFQVIERPLGRESAFIDGMGIIEFFDVIIDESFDDRSDAFLFSLQVAS